MFILPTLIYALLGATLSWATPSPVVRRDILSVPVLNHTAVQDARDQSVNCHGGMGCSIQSVIGDGLDGLGSLVGKIQDDDWYNNKKQIACSGSLCAFLQNSNGGTGQQIKALAVSLSHYGCKVCGSIAMDGVDVANGELTYNVVGRPLCEYGVCQPPGL